MSQPKALELTDDDVAEAARLIFAELCPGLIMTEEDVAHYEAAARSAFTVAVREAERLREARRRPAKPELEYRVWVQSPTACLYATCKTMAFAEGQRDAALNERGVRCAWISTSKSGPGKRVTGSLRHVRS